jgi:hypothetical protein
MTDRVRTYKIWYPENYAANATRRADEAAARATSARLLAHERVRAAAEPIIRQSGCQFVRDHADSVRGMAKVVQSASNLRSSRDEIVIDAAAAQGAALNLQRASYVLASVLGVPMDQPLGAIDPQATLASIQLSDVTRSLRAIHGVVLEAISALTLIKATQAAADSRLKLLSDALLNESVDLAALRALADGDRAAADDAWAIADSFTLHAPSAEIHTESELSEPTDARTDETPAA